jgi:hypothetical protein
MVGGFRRIELARICNAWNVPVSAGATKEEMLAALRPLESRGVDLLKPPKTFPERATYSGKSLAETVTEAERALAAKQDAEIKAAALAAKSPELRQKLKAMQIGKLRAFAKTIGIPGRPTDKRDDIVNKIIELKADEAEAALA